MELVVFVVELLWFVVLCLICNVVLVGLLIFLLGIGLVVLWIVIDWIVWGEDDFL